MIKLPLDDCFLKPWLLTTSCMLIKVFPWALRSLLLRSRITEKEVVHLDNLLLQYWAISPATSTLRLLSHLIFPLDILVLT